MIYSVEQLRIVLNDPTTYQLINPYTVDPEWGTETTKVALMLSEGVLVIGRQGWEQQEYRKTPSTGDAAAISRWLDAQGFRNKLYYYEYYCENGFFIKMTEETLFWYLTAHGALKVFPRRRISRTELIDYEPKNIPKLLDKLR